MSDLTKCKHCKNTMKLVRHASIFDCPGHDVLMATKLNVKTFLCLRRRRLIISQSVEPDRATKSPLRDA
jgi:translation initiation factor 2 gamma subunit (eIF-2gamma)